MTQPPRTAVGAPPEPAAAPVPVDPPQGGRPKGRLLLALVAIAGVLAGAVGTAFLVTAAFLSAAEDIGRGMSEGLGSDLGRSVGAGLTQSMRDAVAAAPEGGIVVEESVQESPVEVQRFPPVEPGTLGRDPVLDHYARSCFTGHLRACDDLLYESPPMSQYERYASTCGGRVRENTVMACIDLA